MRQARRIAVSVVLPLLYAAAVFVATRHPKPVYAFADPTVVTVSDRPGPAILHAPEAIYPAQAFRDRTEGVVKVRVAIAADGTVSRADAVSGPAALTGAALDAVRGYQFEAKAAETEIDIAFSRRTATRSFAAPEVVTRVAPRTRLHGTVRLAVRVGSEGRVDFVQAVSGPEELIPAATEAVRRWTFRPAMRNGAPAPGSLVVELGL